MRVAIHVRPALHMAGPHDPGLVVDLPDGCDGLSLLLVGPAGHARHVLALFGPRGGITLTRGFAAAYSALATDVDWAPPVAAELLAPPLPADAVAPCPLSAAAVLEHLRAWPTLSALNHLVETHGGGDAWVLPPLGPQANVVASVLFRAADGWLLVPAAWSDPDSGWEQLDLAAAAVLPDRPALAAALALWSHATEAVRAAVTQAQPAAVAGR